MSQDDGERLATCVRSLAGEDGKKSGKNNGTVDRIGESAHDGARDEGGGEIDLKPWVTVFERALPGRGEPFFFFDTDHRPGLGADFYGLFFEQRLPAHQTNKLARVVANWWGRRGK